MPTVPTKYLEGDSQIGGWDASRLLPAKFLEKTYQIVNDPANNDIISWTDDGSTFIVWNPTVFASDLLKKNFKHDNFSSFHRQLNNYGFRKVNADRWKFSNELFWRGRLLCDIRPIPSKGARPAVPAVTVAAAPPLPQGMGSPSISGEFVVIALKSRTKLAQGISRP